MRTQLPVLAFGVLSMFACNLASAHGLWTEQRRGHIEVIYGHGAEDDPYKPQKVSRAWAYDLHGKMIPVTVEQLTDHARLEPIHPPAVVAVAFDNGMWSQTADKKWVNQGRSKVPGATSSTHTFKYSLAFHHEGGKVPELDRLKLVIVPQQDPLLVGPGNPLTVKVLLNGKPAAGLKLIGDYRGAPDVVSAETDSQGLAKVLVRNEGLNVIATQAVVPVANDPDVTEEGLFTSLTFVGKSHHD
jgi:uncharacterized GH25 family protein